MSIANIAFRRVSKHAAGRVGQKARAVAKRRDASRAARRCRRINRSAK